MAKIKKVVPPGNVGKKFAKAVDPTNPNAKPGKTEKIPEQGKEIKDPDAQTKE